MANSKPVSGGAGGDDDEPQIAQISQIFREEDFGERFFPRLPHSGGMHWLDWAEVSVDGKTVRAGRMMRAGQFFLVDGVFMGSALIELMAQAAAAGAIANAERGGKKLVRGFLAAVKEFRVAGAVRVGDEVVVTAVEERTFGGFTGARLEARVRGNIVAQGAMTFHLQFE